MEVLTITLPGALSPPYPVPRMCYKLHLVHLPLPSTLLSCQNLWLPWAEGKPWGFAWLIQEGLDFSLHLFPNDTSLNFWRRKGKKKENEEMGTGLGSPIFEAMWCGVGAVMLCLLPRPAYATCHVGMERVA